MPKEQISKDESAEYSVSTQPSRSPRTVSFTIPARPQLRLPAGVSLRYLLLAIALVAVAILGGVVGAWLESGANQNGLLTAGLSGQKKIVTSESQLISQIAKTVGPSVVSVNVAITNSTTNPLDQFGFFGFSQPQQEAAAGTGIILTSDGIIITNRHVVPTGTTSVSVTLSDGTELKDVSVIGRTSDSDSLDIAFLKINNAKGHKLAPAVLGDSANVQVGDDVVAIGNALGQFQNTVTSGIISGYGRSVQASDSSGTTSSESLVDLFQTDAAINEGNSGGPLVNLNGQVIGINTAIAGNAQNIGFSIPINDVKGLIEQVIKTGKFARPYLGVRYVSLTADVANTYGLSVTQGAFIPPSADPTNPSVVPGGPADKSGVQERDVITAVDGTQVDQTHSLTSLLDQHQPGDHITLTVLRDSKTLQIGVELGSLPSS